MKFDTGAEDLPVDASMSTGNPNTGATHIAREDCLHLADPEWEALQRLSTVIGEAVVATMLRTLSPTEQHGVALGFIMKEQREPAARATVSTPSTPRVESLKLHVKSYVGRRGEPLLRWLVEVDTTITARRIVDRLRSPCNALAGEQDDKFDIVLGMPWLARHDPVIDWTKRTIVHFGSSGATVSDDPVGADRAPRGARDPPGETARRAAVSGHPARTPTTERVVGRKCESNQKTQIRSDSRGSRSVKSDAFVSTISVDTQVQQEKPVTNKYTRKLRELMGLAQTSKDAPPSGVKPGCTTKRYAIKQGLITCARGLNPPVIKRKICPRPGPGQNKKRGTGFRTRSERRKRAKLRKSRSGTKALLAVSAGQTQELETTVETLSVLTLTSWTRFARDQHDGRIEQICILSDVERMKCEAEELKQLIAEGVDALSAKSKKERFDEQSWDSPKSSPFYEVLREYRDVRPDDIPAELPQDKGIQHEIDLVPGTKYCVTRQWPLPREQVKAIDDFFESRRKAGQVRESKSPHTSAPTFCVKKAQGGWCIVHAYNKLNDATVPAQTPIPREDVIIDSMALSTIFSALDRRDGFYQILMRESDIPLTAVSTPSGMLWEWLVMPHGLKNAPATFNRCVTHLLRSVRDIAPSYFDDVFIHSRAVDGKSEVEMHKEHLRRLFALTRLREPEEMYLRV
ncbi:hypothetical protein PR001_g12354 [Phytophthora rubi]|uniref:Reverse transcriptase domain-containing protein n=1 Tax=Phytophthora rubi TaxID=129364 RepID=A0A6A3M1M2_9STRA|nr:hypothetical protein PR001_g12354 [Phytophthora rubi]